MRVYLDRIHRSDDGIELHDHPSKWIASLVLVGGYNESIRREGTRHGGAPYFWIAHRRLGSGSISALRRSTFHRVDLVGGECWVLSVEIASCRPPDVGSWGFWSPITGETTPWADFARNSGASSAGSREKSIPS